MSAVLQCFVVTKKLYELTQEDIDSNREETISEIEKLLEEREVLLPKILPPFSADEEKMGKQMLLWNEAINEKLLLIKRLINKDINGLEKKKTTAKRYSNPYENMNFDGMFYDKRK
ncbi:flagellar assembly protein FliT [Falsibacillus pallidus]|uniref:Flagellar protein FliT n=1 Tax=Falsibacillus pallidus TaxID=493781 RepID=A0A370G8K5_9BACI|nr:flagellar assembly protein FliT [Falsibacillus pallidus]RDI40111.1 flagellar protein FliT [Falsibacillus pallidus]